MMDIPEAVDSTRQVIDSATPRVEYYTRADIVTLAVRAYLRGQRHALTCDELLDHPGLRADVVARLGEVIDGLEAA